MSAIAGLLFGGLIGLVVSSAIIYFALHSSFYDPQARNQDPENGPRRVRAGAVSLIVILTVLGALIGLAIRHLSTS